MMYEIIPIKNRVVFHHPQGKSPTTTLTTPDHPHLGVANLWPTPAARLEGWEGEGLGGRFSNC